MLRKLLRAVAIVALGSAAERLGYAFLPAADLAKERAYDGERLRDLDDLSGELAAAHQAAAIWKSAAKWYRGELVSHGVEMGVTCGDEDDAAEELPPC